MTKGSQDLVAPCGVYCGACPALVKSNTCLGCRSEDRNQKRTSKWNCRIRDCVLSKKGTDFCFQCDEYPCKNLTDKLRDSHPDDSRYSYRHEILTNLEGVRELGIERWVRNQKKKWTCRRCRGTVMFYSYKCATCGLEHVGDDGTVINDT